MGKRILGALGATIAAVAVLSACSSANVSTTGTEATASNASQQSCVNQANAILTTAEKAPTLSIPTIPGGIAALRGKSVWFITDTTATLLSDQANGLKTALSAAGVSTVLFNSQSAVDKENQGIQEAVGAHAAAIVIDAIGTQQIDSALGQAAAANIPVVSIYEQANSPNAKKALKAAVFLDGSQTGKTMAAYALAHTGCKADVGFIYSPLYSLHQAVLPAIKSLFAQLCPNTCTLHPVAYNIENVSTTVGPQAVSLVSSNSGMNALILATDDLTTTAVSALNASQKHVLVISEGGDPQSLALVKSGGLIQADIANSSNDFVGWTTADTVLRVLSGQQPASMDTFFTRLLTTKTIPADPSQYFPFQNYADLFKKAWGVS